MPLSIVILIAMTVVVAVLAGYRMIIARKEDDTIHMNDPRGEIVSNQKKVATSLASIDRVGIAVTIATAVYGVALLANSLYQDLAHPGLQ